MRKTKLNERRKTSSAYFDTSKNVMAVKVFPGEYKISAEPMEMLVTTLGSCVAACIRDPHTGIGGMNHFMLPTGKEKSTWGGSSSALRYGNHAMETLINEIIRHGCPKEELEIKVFGGGNVIRGNTAIGTDNAKFVLEYLKNEGLKVAAKDLGGSVGRRIHYFPATGKVKRQLLRRKTDDKNLVAEENRYQQKIGNETSSGGDVELFE